MTLVCNTPCGSVLNCKWFQFNPPNCWFWVVNFISVVILSSQRSWKWTRHEQMNDLLHSAGCNSRSTEIIAINIINSTGQNLMQDHGPVASERLTSKFSNKCIITKIVDYNSTGRREPSTYILDYSLHSQHQSTTKWNRTITDLASQTRPTCTFILIQFHIFLVGYNLDQTRIPC